MTTATATAAQQLFHQHQYHHHSPSEIIKTDCYTYTLKHMLWKTQHEDKRMWRGGDWRRPYGLDMVIIMMLTNQNKTGRPHAPSPRPRPQAPQTSPNNNPKWTT